IRSTNRWKLAPSVSTATRSGSPIEARKRSASAGLSMYRVEVPDARVAGRGWDGGEECDGTRSVPRVAGQAVAVPGLARGRTRVFVNSLVRDARKEADC